MKAKIMIDCLRKMNPEADVKLHSPHGETSLFVLQDAKKKDVIWIECESDCDDLGGQIDKYVRELDAAGYEELDIYLAMFECGITIELIERHLGSERAAIMKKYCESHGLL